MGLWLLLLNLVLLNLWVHDLLILWVHDLLIRICALRCLVDRVCNTHLLCLLPIKHRNRAQIILFALHSWLIRKVASLSTIINTLVSVWVLLLSNHAHVNESFFIISLSGNHAVLGALFRDVSWCHVFYFVIYLLYLLLVDSFCNYGSAASWAIRISFVVFRQSFINFKFARNSLMRRW